MNIAISDLPVLPDWLYNNNVLLGAYLGGLIDGDGNICIRERVNKCTIEIFNHNKQFILKSLIKDRLNCGTWIRKMKSNCYAVGFLVSHKNYRFLGNYVLPYLTIQHKRDKLEAFIDIIDNKVRKGL